MRARSSTQLELLRWSSCADGDHEHQGGLGGEVPRLICTSCPANSRPPGRFPTARAAHDLVARRERDHSERARAEVLEGPAMSSLSTRLSSRMGARSCTARPVAESDGTTAPIVFSACAPSAAATTRSPDRVGDNHRGEVGAGGASHGSATSRSASRGR